MHERPGVKAIWTLEPAKGVSDDNGPAEDRLHTGGAAHGPSTNHDGVLSKTLPSDVESKHPHNLRSANSYRFPEYKLPLFLIVVSSDVVCERVWCFAWLLGCRRTPLVAGCPSAIRRRRKPACELPTALLQQFLANAPP
jgi:hypothetical protein